MSVGEEKTIATSAAPALSAGSVAPAPMPAGGVTKRRICGKRKSRHSLPSSGEEDAQTEAGVLEQFVVRMLEQSRSDPALKAILQEMAKEDKITAMVHRCWAGGLPALIMTAPTETEAETQTDAKEGLIPFTYSIGNPKLVGAPELAISGMTMQQSSTIINNVFKCLKERLVSVGDIKDGANLSHEMISTDPAGKCTVFKLVKITNPTNRLTQAIESNVAKNELATYPSFGQAIQILWPDIHGNYNDTKTQIRL